MKFPRRIYTVTEFMKARECIEKGYKHRLKVAGSKEFKEKVKKIQNLLRTTNHYNFTRTYIRRLQEVDGVSQLRETEATIWLNSYLVENSIEGARFIVQKVQQMKDYLNGKQYYEKGEMEAIQKSIEFLKALECKRICDDLKLKCREALKQWTKENIL